MRDRASPKWIVASILVTVVIALMMSVPASALDIESGVGITVFPLRGADIGPNISVGVIDLPDKWGPFANETLFVDFGQFDGKATLGLAISVRGSTDTRLRCGVILLQEDGNDRQAYIRYGYPLTLD